MSERIEAHINNDMLVWVREEAGYIREKAAKKLNVSTERLTNWEEGELHLTIKQLKRISKLYKRAMAAFYLHEKPEGFEPIHDYRRFPGEQLGEDFVALKLEIRKAYEKREIGIDLYSNFEDVPPSVDLKFNLRHNSEVIAERVRTALGIDLNAQRRWKKSLSVFNQWRDLMESHGIFVFQTSGVALSIMRGFSIAEHPHPVIVINNKDSERGKVFTLLHELTHIMLSKAGLCNDIFIDSDRPPEEQRIEVFCNHVSGAILVPSRDLLSEPLVQEKRGKIRWTNEELQILTSIFKGASREAILRRLLLAKRTTKTFYEEMRKKFQEEYDERGKPSYIVPWYRRYLNRDGQLFTQLVIGSNR